MGQWWEPTETELLDLATLLFYLESFYNAGFFRRHSVDFKLLHCLKT